MYGETQVVPSTANRRGGLSPHVRGNPTHTNSQGTVIRSIPACTGKPAHHQRGGRASRVYPRMYGETQSCSTASLMLQGLSPHVRGNLGHQRGAGGSLGSIPACTGKPGAGGYRAPFAQVYPRMYGETPLSSRGNDAARGLSPHVRGNHRGRCRGGVLGRSIPACTGKPRPRPYPWLAPTVYPRMYGETLGHRHTNSAKPGLSPHVRGNPSAAPIPAAALGSIPACTGKPSGS